MSQSELQKLEKNVQTLVELSSQLKEANQSLLNKNTKLQEDNAKINSRLLTAQSKITKLISNIKDKIPQ